MSELLTTTAKKSVTYYTYSEYSDKRTEKTKIQIIHLEKSKCHKSHTDVLWQSIIYSTQWQLFLFWSCVLILFSFFFLCCYFLPVPRLFFCSLHFQFYTVRCMWLFHEFYSVTLVICPMDDLSYTCVYDV